MHPFISLTLFLFVGLALAWVGVVFATARMLRYPPRRGYAWAVARGRPGDPSELPRPRAFTAWTHREGGSTSRQFPAWSIDGDDPAGPIVVFSHGWGESKLSVLIRLAALTPIASKIVAWDLPGHGDASRGPTDLGTREHGALESLVCELNANGMPVVLYGFSLGAGIGLRCASERELPIAGVILEAPYLFAHTPAESVMRARGVPVRGVLWPALVMIGLRLPNGPRWRGFDRREIAARVACPVLVIHGDRDAICPLADGRAIAERARDGRLAIIEGAGHNDLWTVPAHVDRTTRAIGDFLHGTRAVAPPTGHPPPNGDRSGMPDIDGDV